MSSPTHATVRRTLLHVSTIAECLSTLDGVCTTAAQCTEVQGSPLAKPAFDALLKAVTTAHGSLSQREQVFLALQAAIKILQADFRQVRIAARTYEATINALANGDPALIHKAGLQSRDPHPPPAALGKVSVLHSKLGKHSSEAILSWPKAPGATNGYAVEVNYTPQSPQGPWTALTSGNSRRRVVKSPTPSAQMLARVAALGPGETQSEWSDPILVTTAP
jgi:hypothetical protein